MDFSGFGSLVSGGGADPMMKLMQQLRGMSIGGGGAPAAGAAPAVPADGAMQPTIGPGAAGPRQAAPGPVKFGLPQGGILGLLQGQSPQGLMGLLNRSTDAGGAPGGGSPLAAPGVGMLPGMPGSPAAGPVAPPPSDPAAGLTMVPSPSRYVGGAPSTAPDIPYGGLIRGINRLLGVPPPTPPATPPQLPTDINPMNQF